MLSPSVPTPVLLRRAARACVCVLSVVCVLPTPCIWVPLPATRVSCVPPFPLCVWLSLPLSLPLLPLLVRGCLWSVLYASLSAAPLSLPVASPLCVRLPDRHSFPAQMATDGSEAWPPPEVLEAADHEVTFAELVPEGIAVVDDMAAFAAAIANDDVVEPARRHFTADDFTVYVMGDTADQYRRVAEATVFVELPLPDGKAGWSGSGTLVRIPAARCELIGRRAPDDTFTSAGAGYTDVLVLWTNWHVAHYPTGAAVGAHGMTADLRGSAGRNMSLVMDYAVGLKPVRLSAGGAFPAFLLLLLACHVTPPVVCSTDGAVDILSFSPKVDAGGSDYALVRIPESDAPAYAKALRCAITLYPVAPVVQKTRPSKSPRTLATGRQRPVTLRSLPSRQRLNSHRHPAELPSLLAPFPRGPSLHVCCDATELDHKVCSFVQQYDSYD